MNPSGGEQLRVRTVFISSRMAELAMERHSAFNAVYEAGLTPMLFEMEPPGSDRKKIDDLVDRADLFLGVYYLSLGTPSSSLCNLSPIEYELYRFVARFDICPHPESWDIQEDDREEISKRMNEPEYIQNLKHRLHSECKKESGPIFNLMKMRARLFLRIHEPDNTLSRKLAEFLEGLTLNQFGNASEGSPQVILFLNEKHRYIPSHIDLFTKVFQKIATALREEKIQLNGLNSESLLLCKVAGPDEPGLIFAILDICFNKALNIKALSIKKIKHEPGRIEVSLLANHFYQSSARAGANQIERAMILLNSRSKDRSQLYQATCHETNNKHNFSVDPEQIPYANYYYEIITFDVPGIIMLAARLVAHFGGNIEFIHFEESHAKTRNNSYYSSLILAIRPLAEDARIQIDDGITLEYELESLLGIAAVFRRSHEEIKARFASDPIEAEIDQEAGVCREDLNRFS